jgi:hypothetical protein
MNEEKLAERFAGYLQKELDWELITSALVAIGWTAAEIIPFSRPELQRTVLDWVKNNAQGQFQNFETQYVFEKSKDATLFVLKWSHVLHRE